MNVQIVTDDSRTDCVERDEPFANNICCMETQTTLLTIHDKECVDMDVSSSESESDSNGGSNTDFNPMTATNESDDSNDERDNSDVDDDTVDSELQAEPKVKRKFIVFEKLLVNFTDCVYCLLQTVSSVCKAYERDNSNLCQVCSVGRRKAWCLQQKGSGMPLGDLHQAASTFFLTAVREQL